MLHFLVVSGDRLHEADEVLVAQFVTPCCWGLLWFNCSQQLSHTHLLGSLSHGRVGGKIGRVKLRKLLGWDRDNLADKAEAAHMSKANQRIHSPLPIGRQVFSHLQDSRAQHFPVVPWEDKCWKSECPSFFLRPASKAELVTMSGICFCSDGVKCPGCVPS